MLLSYKEERVEGLLFSVRISGNLGVGITHQSQVARKQSKRLVGILLHSFGFTASNFYCT
jgi:hypothetical protein